MKLPNWPPRDWRAIIALLASVGGAGVLTIGLAYIVRLFEVWHLPEPLANIAYGLLGIIGIVLFALGFAINRRSVKGSIGPATFEASGGDET